jgi:hypothetical protein
MEQLIPHFVELNKNRTTQKWAPVDGRIMISIFNDRDGVHDSPAITMSNVIEPTQ